MEWEVLFDEECRIWFDSLEEKLQDAILSCVAVLQQRGPNLGRPRVDSVAGSKHSNMKELRIQYRGNPWRILFAFDSRRRAVLLIGGNKAEDNAPVAAEHSRSRTKNSSDTSRGWKARLDMAIDAREIIASLPESRQERIRAMAGQDSRPDTLRPANLPSLSSP